MSTPDTMNLDQAADYLKISTDTMRDLADSGTIPGAKVGKQWVFRTPDLDAYLVAEVALQTEERRKASQLGQRKRVPTAATVVRDAQGGRRRVPPALPGLPVGA
jgi:excisionase family DNA binding protein